MRGILFILYIDRLLFYSGRFQKWQEDITNNEGLVGLGVVHAFANNQQEELLVAGRRWIKPGDKGPMFKEGELQGAVVIQTFFTAMSKFVNSTMNS